MTPPTRREMMRAAGLAATALGATSLAGCSSAEDVKAGPQTIKASDVPVGSGKIIEGSTYVVTQPKAGTYCAFSRVCPHAGCNVDSIQDTNIVCSCHGSEFSITDGSPTHGPATAALTKASVTKKGTDLTVGA